MRLINFDPDKLVYPKDWKEKAQELLEALKEAPDASARAKIIKDNPLWTSLRRLLRDLSNGKCWYTESKQEGTDVDIDHFRPKKRVIELSDEHQGYWWLAYAPANYRFSCIVANRRRLDVEYGNTGGKADHFPIADEGSRACTPNADCDAEKPLLIDPCRQGEPELITFKEDGEAMPRFPNTPLNAYKYAKANKSIELYSLNHSDFVKARLDLKDKLEKLNLQALRYYARLETGDADHEAAYRQALYNMKQLSSDREPHSAFCIAMLNKYRDEQHMYGMFYA